MFGKLQLISRVTSVQQDQTVQDSDNRRIVQLFETVLDKPVPIHIQSIPTSTSQADQDDWEYIFRVYKFSHIDECIEIACSTFYGIAE